MNQKETLWEGLLKGVCLRREGVLLNEPNLSHGSRLSIVTVNVILVNCINLKRLGRLDAWGQVDRHQIDSIRNEIKARNFDLLIDTGDIQ